MAKAKIEEHGAAIADASMSSFFLLDSPLLSGVVRSHFTTPLRISEQR